MTTEGYIGGFCGTLAMAFVYQDALGYGISIGYGICWMLSLLFRGTSQ